MNHRTQRLLLLIGGVLLVILALVDSNDPAVSIAATHLLELLDAHSETEKLIGDK